MSASDVNVRGAMRANAAPEPISLQETLSVAHSRGYWVFVVRPLRHAARRFESVLDLQRVVEECAVQHRGWDFPHINRELPPTIGEDWLAQHENWENYVEAWRVFQSGQFHYTGGIRYDWFDRSNWTRPTHSVPAGRLLLGIGDTVFKLTEMFEFAGRYSRRLEFSEGLLVRAEVHGLAGRHLWVDSQNRAPLFSAHRSTLPKWSFEVRVSVADIVGQGDQMATNASRDLFQRFGWDAPESTIREQQAELRSLR